MKRLPNRAAGRPARGIVYGARLEIDRWQRPAAILAPDIAMTGYLAGTRPGAHLYNLTHATPLPAVMLGASSWDADRLDMALAPGLARPHRPGPAPRHGPEVQRPLHPHPPR
jgi:hypothetical protein